MRITTSGIAIAAALFAAPALAQEPPRLDDFERQAAFVREVETILREADKAQANNNCQLRDSLLLTFKTTVESKRAAMTPEAAKDEWRARAQEILNRRCPQAAKTPEATPAAAPGAPTESVMDAMGETTPNRSSLDVLRERMDALIAECDDLKAYADAKRDLLGEIERSMGRETDPGKQIELRDLYRRYATRLPPTCTPRKAERPVADVSQPGDTAAQTKVPPKVKARLVLDLLWVSRFLPLGKKRPRLAPMPPEMPPQER